MYQMILIFMKKINDVISSVKKESTNTLLPFYHKLRALQLKPEERC